LQIAEKFEELAVESKASAPRRGWRPSGDPAIDTYGTRRPVLLAELERLEQLKETLADELDVGCVTALTNN
jgi:hypothetical protein